MPWVIIGNKKKRKPQNESLACNFNAENHLSKSLCQKYIEFCDYMNIIGKPVTNIYYDNKVFIATDAEHSTAIWDHLYSKWTGNNITDVIINNTIIRFTDFYNRFYLRVKDDDEDDQDDQEE